MTRFTIALLLTAIASYVALYALPWWTPMAIAFVVILLLPMRGGRAFLATGLGTAIAYFVMCMITDIANDHILSSRMAVLFSLPSFTLIILLTVLTGFITSGLGGFAAASFIQVFKKQGDKNAVPAHPSGEGGS